MIKLPFEIIRLLWNCGNNRIEHLDGFAKEFCNATNLPLASFPICNLSGILGY